MNLIINVKELLSKQTQDVMVILKTKQKQKKKLRNKLLKTKNNKETVQ